ncbi:MAG: M28 family peptidase [Halobacteriales archaeon]|nr:M28 family peptidase [Halobacteriales archaeon]
MSMEEYALYEREEPNLTGVERTLYDAISREEPWALVEEFAELERVSGSEDEKRAAEYIVDRLDSFGVPTDRYDPELFLSIPKDASLRATAPVDRTFDAVKTVSFSESGAVSGAVVHVDPPEMEDGALALNATFDDLEADIDGKIVLVEANYLSREMIQDIEDRGAIAIIGIQLHDREPHEGIATPIWGAVPEPDRTERMPGIIVTNVSKTVGDELRELATDGLEVELSADAPKQWRDCPVVVSRIPGEADPDDDDFVLLHGHYDSWHYGVTDNATGDAGLLELARVFNEHRDELSRDLWVAWWPAHSTGRYAGSTWFATEFAHTLDERCVAHVNMDSPGAKDATEFTDMSCWMQEGDDLCQSAIDDVCGKDATQQRYHRAGDASFLNLGITGLFMLSSNIPKEVREARGYHPIGGSGGNSNAWHLTTDTLDKADPDVLVRDIRVYAIVLARLLRAEVLPLDHRATVAEHQRIVEEYAEATEFDLSVVETHLNDLAAEIETFYAAVEAGETPPATANETIKQLSRQLVRLNYVTEGRFEQDPALGRPPYPRLARVTVLDELDGDDKRFLETHLRRARNAVVADLKAATDLLG